MPETATADDLLPEVRELLAAIAEAHGDEPPDFDEDAMRSVLAGLLEQTEGQDADGLEEMHDYASTPLSENQDGSLAEHTAQWWNSHGEPSEDDRDAAAAELDGTGWGVWLDAESGEWQAVSMEDADGLPDDAVVVYAAQRAPAGGILLSGKHYRGGQWIPGAALADADPATKARITRAANVHKERVRSRMATREQVRQKTAKHKDKELTPRQKTQARQMLAQLIEHHGEHVVSRLDEIAEQTQAMLERITEDAPNDVMQEQLETRLAQLHIAADLAEERGHGAEYEEEARKAAEKAKPKEKKARKRSRTGDTLYKIIQDRGGISLASLRHTHDVKVEFIESGLGGLLRDPSKTGKPIASLDQWAQTLEEEGHIRIPGNQNATDYLLEELKGRAKSMAANLDEEIGRAYKEYLKEKLNAERENSESEAAEAVRDGEAAGEAEAEEGDAWEGAGELAAEEEGSSPGDFEFGLNEPVSDAETEKKFASRPGVKLIRAPAGGAVSDVDGEFYKGGQLMPLHGMYSGQEKTKGKGEEAGPQKELEGKGKPEERSEPRVRTPEEIEDMRQRKEDQAKWDEMRGGIIGKFKWLGESPNAKGKEGRTDLDRWQEFAGSTGEDKLKKIVDALRKERDARIDSEGHDKDGADWFKGEPQRLAEDDAGMFKRGKYASKHPSSFLARHYIHDALNSAKNVEEMHALEKKLAAILNDNKPAAPPEPAPEKSVKNTDKDLTKLGEPAKMTPDTETPSGGNPMSRKEIDKQYTTPTAGVPDQILVVGRDKDGNVKHVSRTADMGADMGRLERDAAMQTKLSANAGHGLAYAVEFGQDVSPQTQAESEDAENRPGFHAGNKWYPYQIVHAPKT